MDASHAAVFYGLIGVVSCLFGFALLTRRVWLAVAGDGFADVIAARSGAPSVVWVNALKKDGLRATGPPLEWRVLTGAAK